MRRLPARLAAAATCGVLVLGPTACDALGGPAQARGPLSEPSDPEITDEAVAATRAAPDVRLAVTTRSADGPVHAFVTTDSRGACAGTFSTGPAGTTEPVRTGGTVYTKSDEAMLRAAAKDTPSSARSRRAAGRPVRASGARSPGRPA